MKIEFFLLIDRCAGTYDNKMNYFFSVISMDIRMMARLTIGTCDTT